MDHNEIYDITVIGGGTTGLFAAYYATMRGMKVKLIEAQAHLGGKVKQFFPEKKIYDIGGFPAITGEALVNQSIEQAQRHHPPLLTNQWVKQIRWEDGCYHLITSQEQVHATKTVLLATGSGTFHVNMPEEWERLPRIEAATDLMGQTSYQGRNVIISTNNKTGLNWALYLEKSAASVTIINPVDRFQQAKEEDIRQLEASTIQVFYQAEITQLSSEENRLAAITIHDQAGTKQQISGDYLLVYHGLKLQATPFEEWEITTDKGRIPVDGDMATNREGIFAAGDAVQYLGKTNLVAPGYTEAITAVNKAHKWLDPSVTEQLYSTVLYR
ncbi:NAD(P)/FAD-dependent oxidoreductase [Gracilibacillus timonensis]|uniref:NAD(P)/FAD-dependent oxidoreductase n=1 Tax=Gracilibacillus timonensis TaxID=1816696 RepID=UPI0008255022|nr:NAD(P)/FAD-dependent oxidoreductase [Gracilibacillus timonensis]